MALDNKENKMETKLDYVSILCLMDNGFRHMVVIYSMTIPERFNPLFNG